MKRLIGVHALSAIAMGLPWPALLVAVWTSTHSELWLGIAGAARMAPYVMFSWLAGQLADRMNRGRCVVATLVVRCVLLGLTAVLLSTGSVEAAVITAGLVIACGTPAYPAIGAEMPKLAGRGSDEATGLLVTVEVGAFFVGPALGGLALGWGEPEAGLYAATFLAAIAVVLVRWVDWDVDAEGAPDGPADEGVDGLFGVIVRSGQARAGLIAVAANNAVDGAISIALLPLAAESWRQGDREFGLATAAIGVGALLAPVLLRTWGIDVRAGRRSALVFAGFTAAISFSAGLWWAVVPVVVIGAASVHVEAVATTMMQRSVPDQARASLLGLADSVMVGSAAVAAAVTPFLADLVGPRVVVLICAAGCLGMAAVMKSPPPVPVDQGYLAGAISSARR